MAPLSVVICPSKYQDGELHTPGKFCTAMVQNSSRWLDAGEKVYPVKIDVNLKKDAVSVSIVECTALYKSQVTFQFAKGTLEKTSALQVEDIIGQVLAIDNTPPARAADADQQQPSNPPPEESGATAPPPPHVQLGQTPEQVEGILGRPDNIADLGTKQIYVFKSLKVIFLNGKVSDIQ